MRIWSTFGGLPQLKSWINVIVPSKKAEAGDLFLIYNMVLMDSAHSLMARLASIISARAPSTIVRMLRFTTPFFCCVFGTDGSQARPV